MKIFKMMLLFGCISALNACYYDKEEELYPKSGGCDTSDTKYSTAVRHIIDGNCMGSACHSGPLPSGVDLSNYTGISAAANNGRLLGALKHQSGFSAMPKGLPQLPPCDIAIIESWVKKGAQNN